MVLFTFKKRIIFTINGCEMCQHGEAGRLRAPFDTSHTPFVHRPEQLATPALFVGLKWCRYAVLLSVLVCVRKVRDDPAAASRIPREPSFRLPAGAQTHGAPTEPPQRPEWTSRGTLVKTTAGMLVREIFRENLGIYPPRV